MSARSQALNIDSISVGPLMMESSPRGNLMQACLLWGWAALKKIKVSCWPPKDYLGDFGTFLIQIHLDSPIGESRLILHDHLRGDRLGIPYSVAHIIQ